MVPQMKGSQPVVMSVVDLCGFLLHAYDTPDANSTRGTLLCE